MLCCCRRRAIPPEANSGPKGSTGFDEKGSVPVIFQQAQPVIEHVTTDELQKRDNLLAAQLFLRGTVLNLVEKDYFHYGERSHNEKCCFLLSDPYGPRKVMTMIQVSPSSPLSLGSSSGKLKFQRTLSGLRFPFVSSLISVDYLSERSKAVVVRVLSAEPSLRQIIYGQNSNKNQDSDFDTGFILGSPLPLEKVASYGRQILEAICFLRVKGIPCVHLHSGNVFVDEDTGTCHLSDYENGVLGIPLQLSSFISIIAQKLRSQQSSFQIDLDLLCFYHVLHEMTLGYQPGTSPNSTDPLKLPQTCPRVVKSILKKIVHGKIQNVLQMLEHELFVDAKLPDHITSFNSYKQKLQDMMPSSSQNSNNNATSLSSSASSTSTVSKRMNDDEEDMA